MKAMQWMVVAFLTVSLLISAPASAGKKDEPDVVVVQHVLIGFKRSVPGKKLDRTKKEAQALADEILQRAGEEDDFAALVKEFSDDRYPGIYKLTNDGAPLLANSFQRRDMAVNFGDVAFELELGECGLARYHAGNSPYGWHIIKRLE